MRRIDPRLLIGGMLIVGGLLSLLEVQGIISNAGGIFWGLIFAAGGVLFLYILFNDPGNWWAAFPGFTLLGLAVASVLPDSLHDYGGLAFFAGISLAFWWVYFSNKERWWAIIPAGVLLTLGIVSSLDNVSGIATGGLFFLGLGLTFALVALLPTREGNQRWAWIPAAVLLLMGFFIMLAAGEWIGYLWPVALIAAGGYLILLWIVVPLEGQSKNADLRETVRQGSQEIAERTLSMGQDLRGIVRQPHPQAGLIIGLALILLGAFYLVDSLNLPWLRWLDFDVLWPVLLIVGGLALLFRRSKGG
jgi:hypothetical protein